MRLRQENGDLGEVRVWGMGRGWKGDGILSECVKLPRFRKTL